MASSTATRTAGHRLGARPSPGGTATRIGRAVWAAAAAAALLAASPAAAQIAGFDDVAAGAYYSDAVDRLAADGVLTGCDESGGFSADSFCPDGAMDRMTMAVWVVRVLDGKDPPPGPSRFPDVNSQLPPFWPPFVERMAELGVTQGCGDGTNFCPSDPVTRDQMAVFLTRAFDLPDGGDPGFSDVPGDAWYRGQVAALAASGITRGCGDGTRFCPRTATTRAQMAAFLWRATQLPEPDPGPGGGGAGGAGPGAEAAPGSGGTSIPAVQAPPKSDPAAYTKFVVDQAVALYGRQGRNRLLEHVNDPANIDGEWYVFVVDGSDNVIGHHDPDRRGADLKGWVGIDNNGYNFGTEMLAADEAGRWVPYVYENPADGTLDDEASFELKNAWVVRHDGLLFGSGWYIDSEEFLPALISEGAGHFRTGGLEAILAFYNAPDGISAGLMPAVAYYNRTDTLDGFFFDFIAAPDGQLLEHVDRSLIGTQVEDLLGPAVQNATSEGVWITADDNPAGTGPEFLHIFAINVDGTLIGGGWYRD